MTGTGRAAYRTAVVVGLLAGSSILVDASSSLACTGATEGAPDASVALASLGASDMGALATPFVRDVAFNGETGTLLTGSDDDAAVSVGTAGLLYAQLGVVLAGLLLLGTGVFLIMKRAQIGDAFRIS